jgi:hypothetical protein
MGWWRSLPRKRAAWRALSPSERRLLLRAAALVLVAEASLRVVGLRATRRLLLREPRSSRSALSAERVTYVTDIAARNVPLTVACLGRSIALARLLSGQGIRSELRIGVRKRASALEAHAWLDVEGAPEGFVPLLVTEP